MLFLNISSYMCAVSRTLLDTMPECVRPPHLSPCEGPKEVIAIFGFNQIKPQDAAGILIDPPPSLA